MREQQGRDFLLLMSAYLYGPGDSFDLKASHVLPVLLRNVQQAKCTGARHFTVWSTGTPRREFLFGKDLVGACLFALQQPKEMLCQVAPDGLLSVGVGHDVAISALVDIIQVVVCTMCAVLNDSSKPDGTPRRLVDVSRRRHLGWRAPASLEESISTTFG